MNKATLETNLRNEVMAAIAEFITKQYETDVLTVSASEFALPLLDAEGNEKYALVKVSIPRGKRTNGTYEPYDGYAAAEEYRAEMDEKAAKKAASAEKKAREEALREQRRALRQAKKAVAEAIAEDSEESAE